MSRAFLLGAGFSRAISERMPLLEDLGSAVAKALDDHQLPAARPDPGEDVEVWLSHALEDQPFFTAEQNLLNHAAALTAIDALRNLVVQRQAEAKGAGIPEWVDDLLTMWHGLREDVITLNWDTFIEDTVDSLGLWSLNYPTSPLDNSSITSHDALNYVPRAAPGSWGGGPPGRVTFRLWKLHGSVDWYWSEGDPFGETVVRRAHSRPVGAMPQESLARRLSSPLLPHPRFRITGTRSSVTCGSGRAAPSRQRRASS